MPIDPSVLAEMSSLGMVFEEIACDPTLADTAQFCEAYGVPMEKSAQFHDSRDDPSHQPIQVLCGDHRVRLTGGCHS